MPRQGSAPKLSTVSYLKRYMISDRSESVDTTLEVIDNGIPIVPLSHIAPMHLNLWWGPNSDPTDQFVDVYIAAVDVRNLPDQAAMDQISYWIGRQVWRTVGTPATVVQTMGHEDTTLEGGISSNIDLVTRTQDYRLALCAVTDQALTYSFVGSVTVQIVLLRRIWSGPDNPATDISYEEFFGEDGVGE